MNTDTFPLPVISYILRYLAYQQIGISEISIGDESCYLIDQNKIMIEQRLWWVSKILSLFVGLHEAAHAVHWHQIKQYSGLISLLAHLWHWLRIAFFFSGCICIVCYLIPTLAIWGVVLVIVGALSVLHSEYVANQRAISYLRDHLHLQVPLAEKYLWVAWQSYLSGAIANIVMITIVMGTMDMYGLLAGFLAKYLIRYIWGTLIQRETSVMEIVLSDRFYPQIANCAA